MSGPDPPGTVDGPPAAGPVPRRPRRTALRGLSPLLWAAVILVGAETALEVRAARRGFATLLFGDTHVAADNAGDEAGDGTGDDAGDDAGGGVPFGPSDGFPFRSPVTPAARVPGTVRVLVFGSSQAFEARLPGRAVFPNKLAGELTDRLGVPVQVLNHSAGGRTVGDHLAAAPGVLDRWRPDAVVLYELSNDFTVEAKRGPDPADSETPADEDRPAAPAPLRWDGPAKLLERTTLYHLVKTNLTPRISRRTPLRGPLPPAARERYLGRVRRFVRVCRARGVPVVVGTLAVSHTGPAVAELPAGFEGAMLRFLPTVSAAGWDGTVRDWNAGLRDLPGTFPDPPAVRVADVAAAAGGRPALFVDFLHPNADGHAVLAETFADALAPVLPARAGPAGGAGAAVGGDAGGGATR